MKPLFEHALVGLDLLAEPSLLGTGLLAGLERLGVKRLTLVHVAEVDYPRVGAIAGFEGQRAQLAEAARELAGSFAHVETVLEVGKPSELLPRSRQELGADLLVLGNRRRGSFWELLTGGGHWEILRKASGPVLVVPLDAAGAPGSAPPHRTGVALLTDFSDGADRSLPLAARVAQVLGSPLCVVHALEGRGLEDPTRTALEERAERARRAGADEVTTLTLPGPASDADETTGAELLVLGTRGLGKVQSLILGSVAREVLAASRVPAILVPR